MKTKKSNKNLIIMINGKKKRRKQQASKNCWLVGNETRVRHTGIIQISRQSSWMHWHIVLVLWQQLSWWCSICSIQSGVSFTSPVTAWKETCSEQFNIWDAKTLLHSHVLEWPNETSTLIELWVFCKMRNAVYVNSIHLLFHHLQHLV